MMAGIDHECSQLVFKDRKLSHYEHLVKILCLGAALMLVQGGFVSSSAASAPEKSTVSAGYGSTAGSFAPLWVAREKGYFKEYDLETKIIYARGVLGVQAMLAGELDFSTVPVRR